MDPKSSLPVGIVVERRPSDHPWEDYTWHVVGVIVGAREDAGEGDTWHEVSRDGDTVRYFAGTATIEMFRREAEAYQVNLNNRTPVVYVVLRDDEDARQPLTVHLATVSAFEAQDYLDSGDEIVDTVAMPDPLKAWVARFVDAHHKEEKFVKRKRDEVRIEDHKFGQEPIFARPRTNGAKT